MKKDILLVALGAGLYLLTLLFIFGPGEAKTDQSTIVGLDGMERRLEKANRHIVDLTNQLKTLKETLRSGTKEGNEEPASEALQTGYNDRVPVLLISCNRIEVSKALNKIMEYRPAGAKFPIIVSQDCGDEATAKVVQKYDHDVIHLRQPNLGPVEGIPPEMTRFENYYKISRHFKWALTEVFDALMFDQVIIVEDDLEIAPDFFNYFEAMLPLLRSDPTLYCVSAWNDNGKADLVSDSSVLYRSDFFPGLGWMMTRELWQELEPKWPAGFWDDWLRHPDQRKDRACIRPEISRTYTFGRIGVSGGQFFDEYLKHIKLNSEPFDFLSQDYSDLVKSNYDEQFQAAVNEAKLVKLQDLGKALINEPGSYRIEYRNNQEFENIAQTFGMMKDLKAGVPRGAYMGVVPIKIKDNPVYIAPAKPWAGYRE